MWRSPIFIVLVLFVIFSCQKQGNSDLVVADGENSTQDTLIVFYADKGIAFQGNSQYDSAFYYYSKSKEVAELQKNYDYMAYNLVAMAHIQRTFADYASSEETLTEALPFLEKNSDNQLAALNLFGIVAKESKNYNEALRYYQQLKPLVTDPVRQAALANNTAAIYMEQQQYAKAILLLEPLLNSRLLDSLPQRRARIMDNLGFAYYKNEQSERGIAMLNAALAIRTEVGDSYGSIISHLHLARFYQNKNLKEAEINATQAYKLATKHKSVDERLEALAFLMVHYSKVARNPFALQYTRLNDSVNLVRNQAKNQFAKIKYDTQKITLQALKYKSEKAELDLKLQSKQFQNYLMGLGLFLLVVLIAYLIHYYKVKNKQERLQTNYNTETRIAKMVHDELANDVFYTMTFAETQDLKDVLKKEQLLIHLDQIYHKTRNISKENSPIDTGETYFSHLKELLSSYKSSKTEVIIRNGNPIDWSKISDDKKIALQRVLQELMVNMKKHSEASFVVVGFDAGSKHIKVTYSDNGIGCSATGILKNGLQNAENRIQAIEGQLTFDFSSSKGFKAQIVLPN
jgi:signal transduction histidine kinase